MHETAIVAALPPESFHIAAQNRLAAEPDEAHGGKGIFPVRRAREMTENRWHGMKNRDAFAAQPPREPLDAL